MQSASHCKPTDVYNMAVCHNDHTCLLDCRGQPLFEHSHIITSCHLSLSLSDLQAVSSTNMDVEKEKEIQDRVLSVVESYDRLADTVILIGDDSDGDGDSDCDAVFHILRRSLGREGLKVKLKEIKMLDGGFPAFARMYSFMCVPSSPPDGLAVSESFMAEKYPSQITDYLFLGGIQSAMTRLCLENLGITHVINATSLRVKYAAPEEYPVSILELPIQDDPNFDISQYFSVIDAFIGDARESKEEARARARILVHCLVGVSRSATLVIAYLMKREHQRFNFSFDNVYAHVQCCRRSIRPNIGFKKQLLLYEKEIRHMVQE